jgi:hypothetical protein
VSGLKLPLLLYLNLGTDMAIACEDDPRVRGALTNEGHPRIREKGELKQRLI